MSTAKYSSTLRLSVPAILENLFNSGILLVDALMVASLGEVPLAATALVNVVLWRLRAVSTVLQAGTGAMVARRWGAGDHLAAREVLTHSTWLGFLIGLACLPLYPLSPWIFERLGAEGGVLVESAAFFQILLLSSPLRVASCHLAAALRAAGDTRTPMLTTLVINIVNIALNWVFIYGNLGCPKLGLWGAGLGTTIAFALEFLILTAVGWRGITPRRLFAESPVEGGPAGEEDAVETTAPLYAPAQSGTGTLSFLASGWRAVLPGVTGRLLRLSGPTLAEEVAVSIGFLGFIGMVATMGQGALAAHASVIRIESFSFNIGFGISLAAATLVGQALGAGFPATARRALAQCVFLAIVMMGVLSIFFAAAPDAFLGWFVSSQGVAFLPLAHMIFAIAAVQQPLIGAAMVLSGGLRGAGMTTAPLVSQLLGTIVVRIGLGYWLGFVVGLGLEGIYLATLADWLLRVGVLSAIVLSGRWERIRV